MRIPSWVTYPHRYSTIVMVVGTKHGKLRKFETSNLNYCGAVILNPLCGGCPKLI